MISITMKLQSVCIYLPLDVRVIAVVPMVRKHLFTLGDQSCVAPHTESLLPSFAA